LKTKKEKLKSEIRVLRNALMLKFRLQLKSTLVDRIIRDRSLIPPDHVIISMAHWIYW